jgi:CubicO group peptidase (beta-lactamase class C family)
VSKIKEMMAELHIPGVAVGVTYREQTFTAGLGITNIDHPLDVDDRTLFQIGSITKTFVGTVAMQLIERGELDLDAPIRAYLPDFAVYDEEASDMVTVRHLFTHTAGWVGDWFPNDLGQGDDAVARYVASMIDTPQLTPPGQILSYNNAGFNVAGRIFEVIVGKPFSYIMQEYLFDPLEMTHTYMLPWKMMTYRFAVGHVVIDDRPSVARPWSIGRASGPAGGIVTNVRDMMNYAQFHLGEGVFKGKRLLGAESLHLLHLPQVSYTPTHRVALTFWVDERRSASTIWHSGGTVGQISRLTIIPDYDFAILLVTNAGTGRQLTPAVTDFALEHYLSVPTPVAPIKETDSQELSEYTGNYSATLTAASVHIQDETLLIRRQSLGGFPTKDTPPTSPELTPPVQYRFYDDDHIIGIHTPHTGDLAQFVRSNDGSIAWLRLNMRLHRASR